jgi:DNA helicase HerA-like ATPase
LEEMQHRSIASSKKDVGALKPLFDPLDGVYYHVTGETAPQGSATGTDLTAEEIAQNFFDHSLVTRDDRRGAFTRFNLWNDPKKRPELILNAEELSNFVVIPSGDEMDSDAFRSTGTTDADAEHLPRPRPEIHNQLTGGMDIGYAFDEDGFPEDEPTSIPEGVLTNHWAMFGASGAGKSINTNGILLSLYRNIGGLTVFADPKAGDMVENYAKSHAATFGDLKDVRVFNVPEVLPAIPFFDIRPYLYEGMSRDDAIQQKVDEFELVMEMVDENYSTAYVAKTVLGALIKTQFDEEHGSDSFTLDDLYDAAVDMYADQTVPRVSHQAPVERILTAQLNNSEQDFKNTMQAVINRLDDLQEDINLYRLFNQNPEWDDEAGTYKTNRKTREQYEEELENTDSDDPNPEPPRSALDFRELLDTDKVILFDTGSFVRDESQQAFSMYILSALWGAVRSRYNDRKSHEEIETTVNLVIDEAAPIVSTELVTNTLIPEAREFGLSLGMVMQFPEQVRKHSDSDTYNELITNVQSKIIGRLEPDDRIAESLAYGDRDKQEIKNKIAQLSGGEWIADLPAPAFGVDVPQPFSIRSLDIPEGHPEGETPFNETEREVFYKRYESRKNRVANKFGYRQPSAKEVAKQQSVGDSVGFSDAKEDDSEDSQESTPSPRVPATGGDTSAEDDAGPESSGHGIVGSESDEEVNLGATADDEPSPAANSTTSSEPAGDSEASLKDDEQTTDTEADTASTDPDSDTPDFGAYAPLSRDALEDVCGEIVIDGRPDLANIAGELLTSLPEEEYYQSLLSLSQIAAMEGIEIKPVALHKSAKQQASGDGVDAEATKRVNAPTGEATPHASDAEETDSGEDDSSSTASDTGAVDSSSSGEEGDTGTPASDDGGNSNSTPQRTGSNSSEDAPENDDIPFEDSTNKMFAGNNTDDDEQQTTDGEDSQQAADEQHPFEADILEPEDADSSKIDLTDDDDEQTAEDNTDSEDPADVTLTTPLPEAYADFNLDRHDDHEFSADDKKFMSLIASAFRDELDWYSLEESMTDVRDRAGEPDVDSLIECGYVDDGKIGNRKYYSLTRKGWRVVGDSVPGNEFGDHMEKMEHRVGVHLLTEHIANREDVAWSEPYARYNGETYDVIGYDAIGGVVATGEVETESNNPTAVAEDYEKLSEAPGDVIWAHPSERAFSEVWKMINESVLDGGLPVRAIERTHRLEEYADDHEISGADVARTYAKLNQDDS